MADATTVIFQEGDSTTVQFLDGDATTVAVGDATSIVVELSGIPIPGEEGGGGGFTESQIRAFAQDVVDDDTDLIRVGTGAGGALSGSYPSPGLALDYATQAELDAEKLVRGDADTALDGRLGAVEATLPSKADLVGGLVPTAQIPSLAITDVFTVANQAAMLALTAQRGDLAIRTDTGHRLVLSADTPGTLSAWIDLGAATDAVSSVNGQTGVIVLGPADVGADTSGAASTAQAYAIQRANHTGTQAPSTITGTAVVTGDARLSDQRTPLDASVTTAKINATGTPSATTFLRGDGSWSTEAVRRRVIAASVLGSSAVNGSPLWNVGTATPVALALGGMVGFRSEVDSQQTVTLVINVTASNLTSGQGVVLVAYAIGTNGLPTGTPLFSSSIVVGAGAAGILATASTVVLPPAPFFLGLLNPSGNAGTVTLSVSQPLGIHMAFSFATSNRPALTQTGLAAVPANVTGWTVDSTAAATRWAIGQYAPVVLARA